MRIVAGDEVLIKEEKMATVEVEVTRDSIVLSKYEDRLKECYKSR